MATKIFDNNDTAYLRWMDKYPSSFVINTHRGSKSKYFVLHRSMCHHISTTTSLQDGAYTMRSYIKVVGDNVNELKQWLKNNRPNYTGHLKECKSCNPA